MPSVVTEIVFSEPSGRPNASVMFASSLVMLSVFIYTDVLRGVSFIAPLILAVGLALIGLAESLSPDRRRITGGLRVTAILLLLGFLSLAVLIPRVILGS